MIDFPDLSDFMMSGPPEATEELGRAAAASPATQGPDEPAEAPKKRHRRSKAQIEADNAAAEAKKAGKDGASTGSAPPSTTTGASDTFFDPAPQPTLGMILGAIDQKAFEINRQTDEQRQRILDAEKGNGALAHATLPGHGSFPPLDAPPEVEEVPDATDTQVLVDELHFLRDDMRELASEIRKLALAVERNREVPEAPKSN